MNTLDFTATREDILKEEITVVFYSGDYALFGCDISDVKIYKETGGSGFDPSVDLCISDSATPDAWLGNLCTVTLGTGGSDAVQIIDEGDSTWYIVFDIASNAIAGHAVGGKITSIVGTGAESGEPVVAQKEGADPTDLRLIRGVMFLETQHFKIDYTQVDPTDERHLVNTGEEIAYDSTFDEVGNCFPDYVEEAALYFEQAHHRYQEWDFEDAVPCGGEGNKYGVSIKPIDSQTQACGEIPILTGESYIMINNNALNLKEAVFHEYFHAVTNSHCRFLDIPNRIFGERWVIEGMTTSVGNIAPDYKENYGLSNFFVNYLRTPYKDLRGGSGYEASLYWFFIGLNKKIDFDGDGKEVYLLPNEETEKVNDNILALWNVLDSLSDKGWDAVEEAIDDAFSEADPGCRSFDESFKHFAKANYFLEEYYPRSLVTFLRHHDSIPIFEADLTQAPAEIFQQEVHTYGVMYYHIKADEEQKIKVTFHSFDPSINFFTYVYPNGNIDNEEGFPYRDDDGNLYTYIEDADGTIIIVGRLDDDCVIDLVGWTHGLRIERFPPALTVRTTCPVDLSLEDPEGLRIDKGINEIPEATYIEMDLDNDGELDDKIVLPDRKLGDYQITVIPESDAEDTDTYTLKVTAGDTTIVLAEDAMISNIPDQPYVVESTEEGIFIQNQPPVAEANGAYTGVEGVPIAFDGTGSYPDGSIVLYEWDFDGDGVYDVSSASSTAIFTWGDDHTGTVELRVTDNNGLSGTGTASITINNVAPTASIVSVEQPEDFILPYHSLTFNGAFGDAGWSDTHTATWDFGDGTIVSGTLTEENDQPDATGTTTAEHAYVEPGTYTVTLTVTDDDGGVGDYAAEVTVISAEEAARIIIDQLEVSVSIVPEEAPKGVSQKIESAINKLEQVINFLDQGKYCDAIGKLDGMITQIEGAIDQANEQRCSVKECKGKECNCIADKAANELIESLEDAREGAIAIRDFISAEHPECA